MTKTLFVESPSVGLVSPEGLLVKNFFNTRADAVTFASKKFAGTKARTSEVDGRDLRWKQLYRQGWRVVPVQHVPVLE